jgi:Predicted periplasmic solute-binding protein
LDLEYPSLIAKHLAEGSTDLGLVSTAALLSIPNPQIISDYGIAASGKVASVCIFSQVPLDRIEKIYLDYQSRTSVRLAEILLKKHWNLDIPLEDAPEQYIDLIERTTAGVIIGDRALQSLDKFEYVYDLAEHWKQLTGLDFIFAAWIANKTLPEPFIQDFNAANEMGLQHIDEVIAMHPYSFYDLNVYYRQKYSV